MITRALHENVSVRILSTGGTTDVFGDPEDAVESTTTYRASLSPVRADEFLTDRDTRITDLRLILPPEAVIHSTSIVVYKGEDYEVTGDPFLLTRNGRGHHIEAIIRRIEG